MVQRLNRSQSTYLGSKVRLGREAALDWNHQRIMDLAKLLGSSAKQSKRSLVPSGMLTQCVKCTVHTGARNFKPGGNI